ncbi:hypothetical protein evm_002858 [Chilo suppressalis]|nr:hypothetical protein evm_002858 [Chilo suppressalis]
MDFLMKICLLSIPLGSLARVISSPRKARLTLGEPSPSYYFTNIDGYPGTYAFGYDISDPHTGNVQFRNEERYPNGTVMGNYGYINANGQYQSYRYVADDKGYRVMNNLEYPPTLRPTQVDASGFESSITWSRPKKSKTNPNYITKLPIKKQINANNVLLPPSHPIVKSDIENKLAKDEKRFPNGTIIGKYSYTDYDGNPIHVKYYADDGSYGVELKSIKILSGTTTNPLMLNFQSPSTEPLLQNSELSLGKSSDFYNPINIKYKTSDTFEILNKEDIKSTADKSSDKVSPDYEIFFRNELKTPKKCGKDKVRIYLDKEKRKIRDVSKSYMEAEQFCNQL